MSEGERMVWAAMFSALMIETSRSDATRGEVLRLCAKGAWMTVVAMHEAPEAIREAGDPEEAAALVMLERMIGTDPGVDHEHGVEGSPL